MNEIPLCSKNVTDFNAEIVFTNARLQSKKSQWKLPSNSQIKNINIIMDCWHDIYFGKYTDEKKTVNDMLNAANSLNLLCQRALTKTDDYLIFYTKKGISNYNGPFLMLRLKNASSVVIIAPHDGSDSAEKSTKLAFKNSRSVACISNGHNKWERSYDFSKNSQCLGFYAVEKLASLIIKPILLNIHGMKDKDTLLVRSRSDTLKKIFIDEFTRLTNIKDIKQFNAWYAIDEIKTPLSLKTEIPIKIHINRPSILWKIIIKIEETFGDVVSKNVNKLY